MRWILLLATAFALQANAQVAQQVQTTTVSPALEVQRLAPQLVGFAGSDLNFANLVNGLTSDSPLPRGISDTPAVPGVTAPTVRTGDR